MDILLCAEKFFNSFDGEKGEIGKSQTGKPIYYFCVKKTDFPIVIVTGAIHAREYITSLLCFRLIDRQIKKGKIGTAYFIPTVNPDGVRICQNNIKDYKANARGVDLNVNFDANWGHGEQNKTTIGAQNYIGKFPFSESESRALKNFTYLVKPQLTVSFHSKGEEIYYEFNQKGKDLERDLYLAKIIQKSNGYKIVTPKNSVGGYKDWCVSKLKIPSFTIEVGNDNLTHPIKENHLGEIYKKNKDVILDLTKGYINARKIYD